ncbi:MAG: ExbD/TolR family protein [Bacteroidia bacterium]
MLRRPSRPLAEFSLASMADIIFLLLIFFLVTSSFVSQSAVQVDLPQSSSESPSRGKFTITITQQGEWYWNDKSIQKEQVEGLISQGFQKVNAADRVVTLRMDKTVPVEEAVYVISIVARLGGSVAIATRK